MATKQKGAWGSRPNEFSKKLVGIVKVITGDLKAKFTLTEDGKKFANGSDSMTVLLSELPKTPKLQPNDKSGKEYRIRMNNDGDQVEALMPVRGHFSAKLVDLGKRPDNGKGEPMPYEKVFGEGTDKEERHLEFFAVYEVTSGHFKGVKLPAYNLHYKFEEDPEKPGFTRFAGSFENKKATRLFQLKDWMEVHGLLDDDCPWDDETILPYLLEKALENDVTVEVNIKDGYILRDGGVLPSDDYNEDQFGGEEESTEDVDEVDTEFPKEEVNITPVKSVVKTLAKPVKAPVKKIRKDAVEEDEDL